MPEQRVIASITLANGTAFAVGEPMPGRLNHEAVVKAIEGPAPESGYWIEVFAEMSDGRKFTAAGINPELVQYEEYKIPSEE